MKRIILLLAVGAAAGAARCSRGGGERREGARCTLQMAAEREGAPVEVTCLIDDPGATPLPGQPRARRS
jgi:hypothetical protein